MSKATTTRLLWMRAWSMAGRSLFYMQFLRPNKNWGEQKCRIRMMCYHLAEERDNHCGDTPENRKWFRDWIKKFERETENHC